jgi:hypothetical protein
VVTVAPDTGARYLSTALYSDDRTEEIPATPEEAEAL